MTRTIVLLSIALAFMAGRADRCVAETIEIPATVTAVEASGGVEIELPPGAVVRVGDEVRIETELPGLGPVPIQTRWQVTVTDGTVAHAAPQGSPSAWPQRGYAAIIRTSAEQPGPESQAQTPADSGAAPDENMAAFQTLTAAADAGDVEAMYQVGIRYEQGLGTEEDIAKAALMYLRAAEKGHVDAMDRMCSLYLQGAGVGQDSAAAFPMCKAAAAAGRPTAMYNLGLMYGWGHGTTRDTTEAARLLNAALAAGQKAAHLALASLYAYGQGVPRDTVRSAQHLMEAFEDGDDAVANYAMQMILDESGGLDRDGRREVQRILREAGAYDGAIDGIFGPATRSALERLLAERSR